MENKDFNRREDDENRNKRPSSPIWLISLLIVGVLYLAVTYFSHAIETAQNKEITYDEFLKKIVANAVKEVEIDTEEGRYNILLHSEANNKLPINYYTGIIENDEGIFNLFNDHNVIYRQKVPEHTSILFAILVNWILPFALIYIVMTLLFRMLMKKGGAGGIMGVGKSNAKVYVEKQTGVTFRDVAGQDEAKDSIKELVDFLHNPEKYVKIGAKLPKGALLVGPPGTGKTLLAKAVAGEAKVPFFSLSGSDFVEMFVGVGASRVRDLFKQAQSMAPCIIFIDEVDAIGKSRDSIYGGGNDEREQTLNALLAEMDGFDPSKGVIILAATNRPEVLDKALLRPGRFDRRIIVDKPDLKGRLETLKVHARNVNMDDTVDLEAVALATSGAVGSDLANIINEAAILAVKEGRTAVCQSDLFESVETVFAGKEKKDRILGKEEKKIVAYHECGHALVTALQKKAEPVQKITIVPRTMGSLGYVMQVPEEEKYLMSKAEILTRITTFCAGRVAEEIFFDSVTTGASNDIEQATELAKNMITRYGMSDSLGFVALEDVQSRYLDGRAVRTCAEDTSARVDAEIKAVIASCYENAKKMISENREALEEIAAFLVEKETITGKEFMNLLYKFHPEMKPAEENKATETVAEQNENVTESAAKQDEKVSESAAKQDEKVTESAANQDEKLTESATEQDDKNNI